MTDIIPVISQIKSLLQLIFCQTDRAIETQINFINSAPILSQLKSLKEIFIDKSILKAIETQKKFLIITNAAIDSIPIVGHLKGLGHYLFGQTQMGNNSMKRSSRTTVVILSAYFSVILFVPITASLETTMTVSSIASITGGIAIDSLITIIENIIHKNGSLNGNYSNFTQLIKKPSDIGNIFDFLVCPLLDGLIGAFVGFKMFQYRNIINNQPQSYSHVVTKHKHVLPTHLIDTLPPPPALPLLNKLNHHGHHALPLPAPFNPFKPKTALNINKVGGKMMVAAAAGANINQFGQYMFYSKATVTARRIIGGIYITFGIVTVVPVFMASVMSMAGHTGSMTEKQIQRIQLFWFGVMLTPAIIALSGLFFVVFGNNIFAYTPLFWVGSLVLFGINSGIK